MLCSSRAILKSAMQTNVCKCRLHNVRLLQFCRRRESGRTFSSESVEPLPKPNETENKYYPPKVQKIVEDISQLTLIEVADLNELLKKTLKIQDAPMMAVGAVGVAAGQAAPQEEEEEEAVQTSTKSSFDVRLTAFDAAKKIGLIKEIKNLIPGTNLVQAKKIVESVPVKVKDNLTKEEAENLVKALETAGGKAEMD